MRKIKTWAAAAAMLALSGAAQSALINRGGGMIYDTTANITWLADMNHAKTSGHDADGIMDWSSSVAWGNSLTIGSFSGWRLPTMVDTGTAGCNFSYDGGSDCGFNVQTKDGSTVYSEMAHLYYTTLGNLAPCAPGGNTPYSCEGQSGWDPTNTALFQNMQSYGYYWSGLEYAPNQDYAWYFSTDGGSQSGTVKYDAMYAVAVRPGDVLQDAGNQVPEPQGLVLALTALAGLGVALRRRRAA